MWTQKKLERLGRLWQKRLRIQDWDIKYELVSTQWVMDAQWATAQVDAKEDKRYAHIKIVEPSVVQNPFVPYDFEMALVHELLHVVLWKLHTTGNTAEEVAIHQLSQALVEGYNE